MTKKIIDSVKKNILEEMKAVIESAKELGFVITIDLVNNEPLAMGNYTMVPTIREKYIRERTLLTLEQLVEKLDHAKSIGARVDVFNWDDECFIVYQVIQKENEVTFIGYVDEETIKETKDSYGFTKDNG